MKIILASKSGVRKEILDKNNIKCEVMPSNVDEDQVKESLQNEKASPELISKNFISSDNDLHKSLSTNFNSRAPPIS